MPYEDVVELALYDPEHGFYAAGGQAGRRGDFITSPEIGPLFGHLVSRAIDHCWDDLGQPQDFTVIEFGAGPGTLARGILAAKPRCADSLTYIAVERSTAQRGLHPEGVESVETLTNERIGGGFTGMVIANELLDNLAFCPIQWDGATCLYSHVDVDERDELVEVYLPIADRLHPVELAGRSTHDQQAAAAWLDSVMGTVLATGRVIVIDYGRLRSEDVTVRTFSDHGTAGQPLGELGSKDITVDVDLEALQLRVRPADTLQLQKVWLESLGIAELVVEGRAIWEREAAVGGLDAIRGLSRAKEAEALCLDAGLGRFCVAEWVI